ncbi:MULTISPECIES: hypothetical protein [unclassified Paenibacillus]|uniref:hypothetical protein n=1 Tax=unclassified Paenibacillus TaxID=185978 RepID=UPI00095675E5|nr:MULTISPECIES: hypothetical protein [unclassified Paenibacillus]ASS66681.1 hypothetical protein CIC07_11245 [Paenibacillus sp. RUD330]SIP98816.1 hypothetical protein SAMN05880555_0225 [Paenibacillus sp. RU4X]SIQ17698.1 hypothetical protein SAMN05880570_0225 [Paenibacillus sp. RU4T]
MKRKGIGGLLALLLLFAFAAQPLSAAPKATSVKVTFVSAKLVENNHVGNEWRYEARAGSKEIEEGHSVTLTLKGSEAIKLKVDVEEQDKIPDLGQGSATIKLSTIKGTVTKKIKVTVVENRGRYSGNTATWEFAFKISKAS